MTGMDGAIWVPAHATNIITSRRNVPKVNVYHTPQEPVDDIEVTPSYFQRPNLGASTHYYDDSDGDLYQMVDEDDGALANGVLGRPYPADTDPSYSLNYQSRSIEIEGYAATIHLTCLRGSPQWLTAVRFCLAGHLMDGIPLDRAHNIGHYEVSEERGDPGLLDLDAIVEDARRMLEDDMTDEWAYFTDDADPQYDANGVRVTGGVYRREFEYWQRAILAPQLQRIEDKIDALTERLDA